MNPAPPKSHSINKGSLYVFMPYIVNNINQRYLNKKGGAG